MKKRIFLGVILFIEAFILLFFVLGKIWTNIPEIVVLKQIYICGEFYFHFVKNLMSVVHFDQLLYAMFGNELPNVAAFISLFVLNLLFIGVYYLIFGILTVVTNNAKEKKIRKVVSPYELTSNEFDKFSYKHYLHRFPIRRVISLIIPTLCILLFIFIRFDKVICYEANSVLEGHGSIYSNHIEKFMNFMFTPLDMHVFFMGLMHTAEGHGYIDIMNNVFGNIKWVEYIIIVLGSLIILAAWYGLFTLFHLILRKPYAKHKANSDRARYVRKMEMIEYRLYNKYKDETNIKADDFMHIVEKEQQQAAKEIAKFKKEASDEEALEAKDSELKKKAYYEEIGQGVTDLGVSSEQVDMDKPIIEREVKYISDEEIDIILDEEPVIEIVEDEKEELSVEFGKNDVFFERYQPDDIEIGIIEEYSEEKYRDEDTSKVSEETEAKEEIVIKTEVKEEVIEDKESNEPSKEKVVEVEEKTETNEVKEEPVTIVEVVELAPVEENVVQEEVKEEVHEEKAVEEKQDNNKIVIEDDLEEKIAEEEKKTKSNKISSDNPFAKWIGRRNNPGYGAKKVPSFKDLHKDEE